MKLVDLVIFLCLLTFNENILAQVEVSGHKFDSSTNKFHFTTNIKNSSSEPISFYIKPNVPKLNTALRNDSTLLNYLLEGINKKSDEASIKIHLIKQAGQLFKSIHFKNDMDLFSGETDYLYSLKYSLMGMLWGQYVKSSKDFFRGFAELLMKTGYFKVEDFRELSTNYHSFGEVKVNDSWIMVDIDPKMPGFIHEYRKSPNGFASYEAIVKDTSIVQKYNINPWWDKKEIIPVSGDILEGYKRNMKKSASTLAVSLYSPLSKPKEISGEFVLCAGCEINWEQSGYVLDLRKNEAKVFFDSLHLMREQLTRLSLDGEISESKGMSFAKKFIYGVNDFFPDEPVDLHMKYFYDFLNNKLFVRYHEHFERFIYRNSPLDTLDLIIPESGFESGALKAPLFVTNCSSKNGFIFGGKQISGNTVFNVWLDENNADSNNVSPDNIFYLQNCSSNGGGKITTAFNPSFIPFALGFELVLKNPENAGAIIVKTESN
ncbi:MAG: hypothetical protein WD048_01865 [Chitinophagales bacterium]